VRFVAEMVGQLDLQRALHQPFGELGEQPAGPDDLLLATGARQRSSITASDSRLPSGSSPTAERTRARLTASSTSSGASSARRPPAATARSVPPAPRCARPPGSLRSSPAERSPGSNPAASKSGPFSSVALLFRLLVRVGMKLQFAHAYTDPRTLPPAETADLEALHDSVPGRRRPPLRNENPRARIDAEGLVR
jgi:hypothetical protein